MQSQSRLVDDLARVASGALGVATGMREEVEGRLRQRFERIVQQMDLVPREEFDAVQAMAARAREEQERLAERLAAAEARLQALEGKARGRARGAAASGGKRQSAASGDKRKSATGGGKRAAGRGTSPRKGGGTSAG